MISEGAIAQLRRLMDARRARDEAKAALKSAEAEYRELEADVYEALAENPIKGSLKLDLGEPWGTVSFSPRETYFGRIIDEEAAVEHYRTHAQLDEMSEPKFVMARINEEVRDCVEQGSTPPPGVDYYTRRGVTITRQKD